MIKQLKKFTINLVAGANVVTVILMLLTGYSDRLNPADHPMLSTAGMAFPIFLLINMVFLFFWLIFKWRMIVIPVVGFALAYVPISIYMPINPKQTVPEDAIKLISYNVCSYGGNYKYEQGFEAVRDYLAGEKPDIVCLQEDVDTWRRYVFRGHIMTPWYWSTNPPATMRWEFIHVSQSYIGSELSIRQRPMAVLPGGWMSTETHSSSSTTISRAVTCRLTTASNTVRY